MNTALVAVAGIVVGVLQVLSLFIVSDLRDRVMRIEGKFMETPKVGP
jgi:hypothetical protein